MSYRSALVDQIVRDMKVLREPVQYPSATFYKKRIALYKLTLRLMDKRVSGK